MLYLRGRIWWVKFKHRGTVYALSTGERNRRAAEAAARALRVEIETRSGDQPGGQPKAGRPCGLTLETLEALDLARAEDEGVSAQQTEALEYRWRVLMRLLGKHADGSRLTIGDVSAYIGRRRKEKIKGQTIRREVGCLVRALRLAKRDRLLRALPFDPDELPHIRGDAPDPARRGKLWRLDQISAVLAHLHPRAVAAGHLERLRLILLTGLRIEELHRLQPEWVVRTLPGAGVRALLHIPAEAAKWGRARTVPLCDEALAIIERSAPFKRLRPNKSLRWASEQAKLPGVLTPRDLRTTFLTLAGATDPVAAQWLGGHVNIATTGLYLRSSEERAIVATLAATETALKGVTIGGVTIAPAGPKGRRKRKQDTGLGG